MTPFELTQKKTPKRRHLEKAANALRQSFRPGKVIKPNNERLTRTSSGTLWRFDWDITKEFLKSQSIFSSLTNLSRANYGDVQNGRRYILDVHEDGTMIDYIVKPGQPSITGKRRNQKAR